MGGRGTFATGNTVPYSYEVDTSFSTDGKFNGIKVLRGIPSLLRNCVYQKHINVLIDSS